MEPCILALQALFAMVPNPYIIIDALDESSEREGQLSLFALLARIHSWNIDKLHILPTSRCRR